MRRLAEADTTHSTVLMVQVENEVGLLGDSRDRSRKADAAFSDLVPEHLLRHLRTTNLHSDSVAHYNSPPGRDTSVSWEKAFGSGTAANEAFTAHHISSYVGRVTAAGKAEYPLPLYTNAWLNRGGTAELDLTDVPIVVGGGQRPANILPVGLSPTCKASGGAMPATSIPTLQMSTSRTTKPSVATGVSRDLCSYPSSVEMLLERATSGSRMPAIVPS